MLLVEQDSVWGQEIKERDRYLANATVCNAPCMEDGYCTGSEAFCSALFCKQFALICPGKHEEFVFIFNKNMNAYFL